MSIILGLGLPLVLAYLLGSFPSAVFFGRLLRGVDPRALGSGNAGATNALRSLGPVPAALTLVADVAKALAAVYLAPLAGVAALGAVDPALKPPLGARDVAALCAACAILGHVLPVFSGFRGGKGVAVAAAALGALHPWAVPCCLLAFGLALSLTGFASLASIAAALCFPVAAFLTGSIAQGMLPGILALAAPLAIVITHRSNIRRLFEGSERRFPRAMIWKRGLDRLRPHPSK